MVLLPATTDTPGAPTAGPEAALRRPGALTFAIDRRPWQRSLRWHDEPRRDLRWWIGIALFSALVTVAELVGFDIGMRASSVGPRHRGDGVLVVQLNEPTVDVPPPPPEPEPPEFKPRASRIPIAAPKLDTRPPPKAYQEDSDAMTARIGAAGAPAPAAPAPAAPQLFNPDGTIRLDGAARLTAPAAPSNPQVAAKERWADIEKRGRNPLDCRKTRFAAGYAPDESVGSGVARKYLSWAGLYDPHETQKRAERASEGCDPPTR